MLRREVAVTGRERGCKPQVWVAAECHTACGHQCLSSPGGVHRAVGGTRSVFSVGGRCPAAPPSVPWVLRAGHGPSLLTWSCTHGPWWSQPGAVQTCWGRLPALPCALGDLPPCSWVSFISATPLAGMKTDGAACGLHRCGDPFHLPFGLACHRSCRCSGLFAGTLGAFTMIYPPALELGYEHSYEFLERQADATVPHQSGRRAQGEVIPAAGAAPAVGAACCL